GLVPTHVRLLGRADDRLSGEVTLVVRLVEGDCILCVAGDVIPCCGTVSEGCASVRDCTFASASADSGQWVVRNGAWVSPGTAVVSSFLILRVGEKITHERTVSI